MINKLTCTIYKGLHKQLQQQREGLKGKLQDISKQKKKAISQQVEQIEHTQAAQLESLNDAMQMDQVTSFVKEQADVDVKRITE